MWDADRTYYLPAGSPIIKWDQENIISIRVMITVAVVACSRGVPTVKLLEPMMA